MKKTLSTIAAGLLLAGCSSTSQETEDNVKVDHVDEVAELLAGTPWECVEWDTYSKELGHCGFEFTPGTHSVHLVDDPEMMSAVIFDENSGIESTVIGENWVFACDTPLVADDCEYLAELMGGEMVEPGHRSS